VVYQQTFVVSFMNVVNHPSQSIWRMDRCKASRY
jgi:hypothetical protein